MSEIVDKLRSMASIETSALYSQRKALNDGADRIEALEKRVEELEGYFIDMKSIIQRAHDSGLSVTVAR